MSIYDKAQLAQLLSSNTYPGRGIVAGMSENGKYAVSVYFIMGRSENSRNRVFCQRDNGDVFTKAFDESRVEDPSLIIYNAVRRTGKYLIVTNGDQTDTAVDGINAGKSFADSLSSRCFEPDGPNFTPRISSMLTFDDGGFKYSMSILKSADENGSGCNRFTFDYEPQAGTGHFIHTYNCDGNPIPTFTGEPERVSIPDDIDAFSADIWNGLNEQNKISLFVRYTEISTQKTEDRIINKNQL